MDENRMRWIDGKTDEGMEPEMNNMYKSDIRLQVSGGTRNKKDKRDYVPPRDALTHAHTAADQSHAHLDVLHCVMKDAMRIMLPMFCGRH